MHCPNEHLKSSIGVDSVKSQYFLKYSIGNKVDSISDKVGNRYDKTNCS